MLIQIVPAWTKHAASVASLYFRCSILNLYMLSNSNENKKLNITQRQYNNNTNNNYNYDNINTTNSGVLIEY